MTGDVFERARSARSCPVRLADVDPRLFRLVPTADRREAAAAAVVPRLLVPAGPWQPAVAPRERLLGLLVLEGLLLSGVDLGGQPRSEVLGPGDLIRPWDDDGHAVRWTALDPLTLAVLDERFAAAAARWPGLVSALVGRAAARSRRLAVQLAMTDIRRIEDRLLAFFWHVAEPWGTAEPDGVVIPLRLTHEELSHVVGAQRPTVTTALRKLVRAGALRRRRDRCWVLRPQRPPSLQQAVLGRAA